MRIALNILGALLLLMGTTWFLQGINVLPGSFMTGQIQWAVYGGVADLVAVVLLVIANRRRRS
jgi:type IV secretory pathway VirB2 component (pilin)